MYSNLTRIRNILFRNVLQTIDAAQTGHLGACCSSLDLMLVLYFGDILRYDSDDPRHHLRDYVLNRGHLGPLKYNIFGLIGWLKQEELSSYREFGSRLAGHEDMYLTPGVDITPSGSLGMGLSYAVGACIGFKDQQMPNRVFCFLGDGEEQGGNVAEAARHAGHLKIPRLIAIIDRNRGTLSGRTHQTDSASNLRKIWEGYGWDVLEITDGHNLEEIRKAYQLALGKAEEKPVCIIANTVKGHGIPGCENDYCGYHVFHGSEVETANEYTRAIDIKGIIGCLERKITRPIVINRFKLPDTMENLPATNEEPIKPVELEVSTSLVSQYDIEEAFLRQLEARIGNRLYVLTADYPPRNFVYDGGGFVLEKCHYYNVGLREQHMTALAHGLAQVRKDAVIVIMCGDAFLYRHMDQINVLAQAGTPVILYSVQGGLSGAKNGSTHQSSGQAGAILTMPGIVCEEPASAEDFIHASNEALTRKVPTYIRMQKLPVPWTFGGSRENGFSVIRFSEHAEGTIVTSGMITNEAHQAVAKLAHMGRDFNLLNVTRLSSCAGIAKWIIKEKPLFIFYNGNPKILEYPITADLCREQQGLPMGILARGFEIGTTGGIVELLKEFGLDKNSIVDTVS